MSNNIIDQNSEAYVQAQLDADYKSSLVPVAQPQSEFSWDALTPQQPVKSAYDMAIENADTYNAYMENMLHQDPNAYRRNQLAVANERNIRRLVGQQQNQQEWVDSMRSRGIDDNTIQEKLAKDNYLNGLSGSERLRNYLNRQRGDTSTFDDPDFEQDIISKDIQYLEATYGKEVANYAFQEQKERFGLIKDATRTDGTDGRDFFSWDTLQDAGASVLTSTARTIGGIQDAIGLATGLQSVEEVANEESIWDKLTESADSLHTDAYKASEQKNQAKELLRDTNKDYNIQQEMGQGLTKDRAESKVKFDNSIEAVKDFFREDGNLFAQATEVLGDIALGGIVAKGASMLARGMSKDLVKSYILKELQKEVKAVGATTSKEVKDKAVSDLVKTRLESVAEQQKLLTGSIQGTSSKVRPQMEAIQSKAKSDIEKSALVQQEIKGVGKSAERKAFNEGKDKARQKAEEIISSFSNTVATGAVAVHGGNQEAIDSLKSGYQLVADMDNTQFSNTTKGKEITQSLNEKYEVSSLEEGLANKDYAKEFNAKKEELATQAAKEAYKRTFIISGALNAVTSGLEKRVGGVAERAKSFKQYVNDFIGNTSKEAIEEAYESASGEYNPKDVTNQVVGSKVYDPNEKVLQSAVQGAVTAGIGSAGISALPLGKSAGKSALNKSTPLISKATKKLEEKQLNQEAKDNQSLFGTSSYTDKDGKIVQGQKGVFGKTFDESEIGKAYISAVDKLANSSKVFKDVIEKHGKHNYTHTVKALYTGYANARKALENQDKLSTEEIQAYTAIKESYENFQQEISQGALKDLADYNNELYNSIQQYIQASQDSSVSQEKLTSIGSKMNDLMSKDEQYQKLVQSPLYARLSSDANAQFAEVNELPSEVSFLDGKNKEDFPEVYNSVKKGVSDISSALRKNEISVEEANTRYAKALTDLYAIKDTNVPASEKLTAIKDLLQEMSDALGSSGRTYGDNSPFKVLSEEINKWKPSNNIDEDTGLSSNDVFLQKFFGSQGVGVYAKNYKHGLLDYARDFLVAKANGQPFPMLGKLQKFYNSQVSKLSALTDMIREMEEDERNGNLKPEYSYKTKYTTLSGEKNKFTSLKAARKYRDMVANEMEGFNRVTQSMLQGTAESKSKKLNPKSNEPKVSNDFPTKENQTEPKQQPTKLPTKENTTDASDIKNTSNTNHPVVKEVFSGGAYGADSIWSRIAKDFGVNPNNIKHYVINNNSSKKVGKVDNVSERLDVIIDSILKSNKRSEKFKNAIKEVLDKFGKSKSVTASLHKRNILQVVNADGVFAVAPIENGKLTGSGTDTAIKLGVAKNIPVYVLDTNTNQWFTNKDGKDDQWISFNGIPKLTSRPALVGTRKLESYKKYNKETGKFDIDSEVLSNTEELQESMRMLFENSLKDVNDNNDSNENENENNQNDQEDSDDNEESNDTGSEVRLGLPYYPNASEPNLLETQDAYYEAHKLHMLNSFMEMDNETIKEMYGDLSKDKTVTFKVPVKSAYRIPKEKFRNSFIKLNKENTELTVELPLTIAKSLMKYGFNIEENSFDMYVSTKKDFTPSIPKDTIKSMIESDIDYDTEEGRETSQAIKDSLQDGTVDYENNSDSGLMAESLTEIAKGIYSFFIGKQKQLFNRHRRQGLVVTKGGLDIDKMPRFLGFNFLTNLFGISYSEKGSVLVNIPENVISAYISAIPKSLVQSMNSHFHKSLEESLMETGKSLLGVYNITNETKDKYISQIELTEDKLSGTSGISGTKRDLIMDLGRNVFEELGLRFTKNTSMEQEDAIQFSLGLEAYNFLKTNGAIQEYIVQLADVESETIDNQVYYGFTWNNTEIMDTETYENTRLLTGKTAKQDNKAYEKAKKDLAKVTGSSNYPNLLELLRTVHSDLAQSLFGENTVLHGVEITNLDDEIGKAPAQGIKATDKDGASKLTTGDNKVLKDALQQANSVAFEPDMMMFEFYDDHPELTKILNGAIPSSVDIDKLPITEESKDALRSRQLRIDRDYGLLDTYRGLAIAQGITDFSKAIFRFAHKLASNSRIMFNSDLDPVASKPVREMLNPVEFTLNQDEEGNVTVQGTIKPSFKVKKSDKARTLDDLIAIGKGRSKQANDAKGFILALAQAVGVKVEKKTYENIVLSLQKDLPQYQKMIDMLWEAQQQGKGYKFDVQLAQSFYDKHGTASSRLMKTLMAFSKFQYQNTKENDKNYGKAGNNDLSVHLYLEADGIANGFYNILKQFSTRFSTKYVMAQKRTGNITTDILAQNLKQLDKLEGARTLFDTYNLDDMYTHIAKSMENKIKGYIPDTIKLMKIPAGNSTVGNLLLPYITNPHTSYYILDSFKVTPTREKAYGYFMAQGFKKERANELANVHFEVMKALNNKAYDDKEFDIFKRQLRSGIRMMGIYGQIILLGGAEDGAVNSYLQAIYKGDLSKLSSPKAIKSFKRGLAKLGVTPAMYGGKLKGVTNQILTSLKPQLLGSLDKVMTLTEEVIKDPSAKNWKDLSQAYADARMFSLVLGISNPLFTKQGFQVETNYAKVFKNRDIETLKQIHPKINRELNNIVDYYKSNKKDINSTISEGIGSFLNSTIQNEFEEHFESISFTMQLNQSLFNIFMSEFTSKLPEFIKQRNKEKGYSDIQGSVGITRAEVKQLMKQMNNIPILGTAFSSNAELIDSLVDLGNTLLKTNGSLAQGNFTNVGSNFGEGSGTNIKSEMIKVYHEGTAFEAAGASINTATTPSTEAMTLHLVQEAMNRVGKAFLNVFDGLDAKFQLRDEVGEGANRHTFDVHANTNLLEAMYQMFNRTTFEEVAKDKYLREYFINAMIIAKYVGSLDDSNELKALKAKARDNMDRIQEFLDLRNMARMSGLPEPKPEKVFEISYTDDKGNKITEVKLPLLSTDDLHFLAEDFEFLNYNDIVYDEGSNGDKRLDSPKHLYNLLRTDTINSYRRKVADNYAIRQLEKNDLAIIVSQFGGSNTGYKHNFDLLKGKKGLASRFIKYAESKQFNLNDQWEMAAALTSFVLSDPELQAKYDKYYSSKLKELDGNTLLTFEETLEDKEIDLTKIKTVGQLQKFLMKLSGSTTQSKVGIAIGNLVNKLSSLDGNSKIYFDLDEYRQAFIDTFKPDLSVASVRERVDRHMIPTEGKFIEGLGIYINPNASFKTMIHELLHAMTRTKINNYYSKNRNERLSWVEKQAIKNIEANARIFTNKMLLDSEVLEAVELLRTEAIQGKELTEFVDKVYGDEKYTTAQSTAINFQFAFEVLPTIEGMSEEQILTQQQRVMNEFIAYGLTEADILNHLKFSKGSELSDIMKNTKGQVQKRVYNQLKRHYDVLKDEMATVMGVNKENDATQSALFNIISSLSVLHDVSQYPNRYELSELVGSKEPRKKPNGVVDNFSNKVIMNVSPEGTVFPEVLNSVSSYGNSTEHLEHLNELTSTITENIQNNEIISDISIANFSTIDDEANQLASDLRSSGLRMTVDEENAFKLVYSANKVAMLGDKTLEQAGYKWLEEVSAILEPDVLGLTKSQFEKVINPMRSTNNKLSYLLALVATNENVRTKLENFYKNKPNKLKDKVKQSLAYTSVYTQEIANSNLTKGADILMQSVQQFSNRDYVSLKQRDSQLKELELKEERLSQVARLFGDLTDSKHIETLVKAMQSGQGTNPNNSDMNSMFTEAINEFVNTYEKGKGRRTWIGTLLRLVVGSTSKTYQWYKAKNQNSTLLESVRERTTATIPAGIRAKFENLTKSDEQAIDAILLPTNFHKIKNFAGIQNQEVIGLLTDSKKANFEKAKVSGFLRAELMSQFGDKEGNRLYNIAMWQIKGLGSLMVTKQAKTKDVKESHYILPNTRAIANLIGSKDKQIQEAIDSLTSIYALDYVDSSHKEQLAKLMSEQIEPMNELLDSVETMYAKSQEKLPNNLLGEDGFVMNHKDPMSNVHVVSPDDLETLSDLRKRGYTEKAKLPTGHLVMHTNMDDSVRFTTGMFNLTESTTNGINLSTLMSLNSKAMKEGKGKTQIPVKILMAAGINENYYDSLEQDTTRRPVINDKGQIVDTAIDLPKDLENQLIPSTENGIDAVGNYFGRIIEEEANLSSNRYAVDLLRQHYLKNVEDRKYYVPFNGEMTAKGTDKKSMLIAEELNNIYKSLPAKTKQYIESTGGVMIDMREVENILGYHQASVSDLWNDRSKLPEPMQKVLRGLFEVFAGVSGYNPVKLAVTLEKGSSELATFTKDIILNRSLFVPIGNLLSNMAHLWTAGVPYNHIVPDSKEGLQLAKDYQSTSNKVSQIEFLLLNHKLQPNERSKLTNELQVLKEKLLKSPIRDLVDNGIFNSVNAQEIASDEDVDFSLWKRVMDKSGLSKIDQASDDLIGKKLANNIMIRKGSSTHNFMVQTMDYGDFVAKYVLYKHLTKRKGISKTNAMEVIRDEFVNYTMNRGREFDWTNKVGLTWFLSYKLSIQKVIFRNLRRNFLRTLATYGIGKVVPDNALLDKTVIEQNLLFDSSLDYQLSPSNLVTGWEQFIWTKVL